ncbi:hypothetical protein Gpo141_00008910 [Globisporangium polare]
MAPNTSSSVFNEAPPPQPATETKPSDAAGAVMVAAPPSDSSSAANAGSAVVTSSASAVPATTVSSSSSSSTSASEDLIQTHAAHRDEAEDLEEAEARRQLQMSRFARVSPAMLDGVKPLTPGGFRKSCLKRSHSALPADISILKRDAKLAGACAPELPAAPVQKNRRRCWECKVKVGLTAVKCRCDYTFCNKHRYAEEHKCTFDFKVSAKRKLEEENPRVVPLKVARIN